MRKVPPGWEPVRVGRLKLAYIEGVSGPESFNGWVLMEDFDRLRRTITAYTLVRQLRLLVATGRDDPDPVDRIFRNEGINLTSASQRPTTRVLYELILYQLGERGSGLTPIKALSLPAYNVAQATLADVKSVLRRIA